MTFSSALLDLSKLVVTKHNLSFYTVSGFKLESNFQFYQNKEVLQNEFLHCYFHDLNSCLWSNHLLFMSIDILNKVCRGSKLIYKFGHQFIGICYPRNIL